MQSLFHTTKSFNDKIGKTNKKEMNVKNYPFAEELITDTEGTILKVILNFKDYQSLLELLEDQALSQAMLETENEIALTLELALEELEKE